MDALDQLAEVPTKLAVEALGPQLEGDRRVGTVFQPIVVLQTGAVAGYEALTRGPAGTRLEAPLELFAAVGRAGDRARFDRACRDAALARAIRGGVEPPMSVFVNVEPSLVENRLPDDEAPEDQAWRYAPDELRCVIEITERALTDRPAELLSSIAEIRDLSWGVALDDVGADPRSLALMSLLRPDVIKLDRRLVQAIPDARVAQTAAAVAAQAERTGAVVVAEGVETEEHEYAAIALGATLGQGWRYGRPAALPQPLPQPGALIAFIDHGLQRGGPTPHRLATQLQTSHRGSQAMLAAMVGHLALQASEQGDAAVILALRLPDLSALEGVVRSASLVGVIADEPQRLDTSGELRTQALDDDDPLRREIALVVLAPHFAGAVTARTIGDLAQADSPVELCATYNRDAVVECARSLVALLPRRA